MSANKDSPYTEKSELDRLASVLGKAQKNGMPRDMATGSNLSWLLSNAGFQTTDHNGAEHAVLDSQRGMAIEQMVKSLPMGDSKAAFANSIVRALEELQVSDSQLTAAIRAMQASLLKAKSEGKNIDASALLDPGGLSNHALKDLLVHVASASREANAEGHIHHDDGISFVGAVVTGAVAIGSGVLKIGAGALGNLVGMFGLSNNNSLPVSDVADVAKAKTPLDAAAQAALAAMKLNTEASKAKNSNMTV